MPHPDTSLELADVVYVLPAEQFAERFGPAEYAEDWEDVTEHPNFWAMNESNPDRIHDDTWIAFLRDVGCRGIQEPVEIDTYSDQVGSGHHRVVAALKAGQPVPFIIDTADADHSLHVELAAYARQEQSHDE